MKKLVLFLITIMLLILDNTLMPFFAVHGIYPSLLFAFIICYSIINGPWEGIALGIFAGVLQDLYLFKGFGVNALCNMLVCLIAAKVGENIFKEKKLVPIFTVFLLSLLKGLLLYIILYVSGVKFEAIKIIYVSIYNLVVTIIMYKKIYKLSYKRFMKKDWNF